MIGNPYYEPYWVEGNADSLEHYGVLGMKWGVRRYQNRDGTLTKKGKAHYSDSGNKSKSSKKSKHRLRLEEKYMQKGMTAEQASVAASKRIKTEKILLSVAGVTVAAAGAYIAYNKYSEEFIDKTLKSGIKFSSISDQTIASKNYKPMSEDAKLLNEFGLGPKDFLDRQRFYASYKDQDNKKYLTELGQKYLNLEKTPVQVTTTAKKDIKIASRSSASKVFSELYKNDSSFRAAVDSSLFRTSQVKGVTDKQFRTLRAGMKDLAKGKTTGAAYNAFNIALVDRNESFLSSTGKFYDALKKQGYSAISDLNGKRYSAFKTKDPLIIFGGKEAVEVSGIKYHGKLSIDKATSSTNENLRKGLKFLFGK